MVTLEEYKVIYEECHKRIETVWRRASCLRDTRYCFDASVLRTSLRSYIPTIEGVYETYTTAPSYKTKDFTNYVAKLQNDVKSFEEQLKNAEEILERNRKLGY